MLLQSASESSSNLVGSALIYATVMVAAAVLMRLVSAVLAAVPHHMSGEARDLRFGLDQILAVVPLP